MEDDTTPEESNRLLTRAVADRRARRASAIDLAECSDLRSRLDDAVERRLSVRVALLGGSSVVGVAAAVAPWGWSIDARRPSGDGPVSLIPSGAVVRVGVAHAGAPTPRPVPATAHSPTFIEALRTLHDERNGLGVHLVDGAVLAGRLCSVGDRLVGLRPDPGGVDAGERTTGWTEWFGPEAIVAVTTTIGASRAR